MVFASSTFIFLLLPLFLALDFAARACGSTTLRNTALLAASLLFYTWGEAGNVLILLAMGAFNYLAGRALPKCGHPRFWLTVCIIANLGLLVAFKYACWLANLVLPGLISQQPVMPLGISFFTFHAISYIVDVHRRDIEPAQSALDFLTYFCMFSHLVAGPIVRYAQIREDMASRGPDRELFAFGMYRFLLGLNKKVIVANTVSIIADKAFDLSSLGSLHFLDAWIGITAYAVQIYFDFSAYSDMAIGLAAMAGFHFEENFRRPYSSASIREFWRRWHISLCQWLRDYLYIPLGGGRAGNFATYRNLIVVFFLCGLWHGANMTFVLWGVWHGIFLVLERISLGRLLEKAPAFLARGYVLLVVLIGWVFFRSENIHTAMQYLANMFSPSLDPVMLIYFRTASLTLLAGVVLCLLPDRIFPAPASRNPGGIPFAMMCAQAVLAVYSVARLLQGTRNPFIYFNF